MAVTVVAVTVVAVSLSNDNGYFHRYGVGLLNLDRNVFFNVYGVWPVYRHFDWVSHRLLNCVRDMLVDDVRLWDWNLHGDGHRLFNWHGVGPIDWYFDWVSNRLLNCVRNRHGFLNRVRSRYVDGVRPVDGDLNWNSDMFHNRVGLRYGNLNFNGVWHMFLHGVWCGHWHLHGVGYVLLNGVGLGNENLHGVRPVDGNVNGVRYFLFNRVGGWYMYRDFDVLFHVNGHVFDDLVRLGYGHLHGVWDRLFYGVRDWLLDGVSNGNTLNDGDSPGGVVMFSEIESITTIAAVFN